MFLVLLIMLCGAAAGYAFRRSARFARAVRGATLPMICLLLFLMGLGVGSNSAVIDRLPALGVDALVLTLGALAGSVLCARFAYRRIYRRPGDDTAGTSSARPSPDADHTAAPPADTTTTPSAEPPHSRRLSCDTRPSAAAETPFCTSLPLAPAPCARPGAHSSTPTIPAER